MSGTVGQLMPMPPAAAPTRRGHYAGRQPRKLWCQRVRQFLNGDIVTVFEPAPLNPNPVHEHPTPRSMRGGFPPQKADP